LIQINGLGLLDFHRNDDQRRRETSGKSALIPPHREGPKIQVSL
jgi:hypothetical protein